MARSTILPRTAPAGGSTATGASVGFDIVISDRVYMRKPTIGENFFSISQPVLVFFFFWYWFSHIMNTSIILYPYRSRLVFAHNEYQYNTIRSVRYSIYDNTTVTNNYQRVCDRYSTVCLGEKERGKRWPVSVGWPSRLAQ